MTRISAVLATAVVAVSLAVGGYFAFRPSDGDPFIDCRRGSVAAGAGSIGGPFTLTGTDGRRVTETDVITRPTLVYFGYTFCPDICPMDAARNALVVADLAEQGVDVGDIFITIDPDRDTQEEVESFTDAIDPTMVGLTGSTEDIAAAAKAYKVYYRKSGDDPEYYLMDHSTFTYLMDPEAGFLEFYPSDTAPEEMAESVACFTEAL